MTRLLLGIIVSGAAASVTLLLLSLFSAAAWQITGSYLRAIRPGARAQLLAVWRLGPGTLAVVIGALTLAAFLRFEPANTHEIVGALLPVSAVAGALAASAGLVRAVRARRQTSRSLRAWRAERASLARALPIVAVEAPFPVVAVVGIWKPRVYVARQVMAGCDADELAAMMAHEAAHVAARDNLTRLLFAGAPVVPFAARAFQQMESAWVAASEEAADDAARRDERSAVALASALTKVARMASERVPLLHASAILSGSSVEHRVRRLLEVAPDAPQARSRFVLPVVAMMGALVVAAGSPVLRVAYDIAEYCVRHLP